MTKKELLKEIEKMEIDIKRKDDLIMQLEKKAHALERELKAPRRPLPECDFINWLRKSNGYVLKYYDGVGILEHIDRLTVEKTTHELFVVIRNKPIKYKTFITEYRKADGSLFEYADYFNIGGDNDL